MKTNNLWAPVLHCPIKESSIVSEITKTSTSDYIYIKLSDNNDYLISPNLGSFVNIILEMNNIQEFGTFLEFHTKTMTRNPWAIIVNPEFLYTNDDLINSLIMSPFSNKFGLRNPNLGDVNKWYELYGTWPDMVSLDSKHVVSEKTLIDFCNSNDIITIYQDSRKLNNPREYLRFVSQECNLVCIETETVEDVLLWFPYVWRFHGKDSSEILEPNNSIKESSKTYNEYYKILGSTWKLENPNNELPLETIYSTTDISKVSKEIVSETERQILEPLSMSLSDDIKNPGEIRYLLRNETETLLRGIIPKSSTETIPLSDNVFLIKTYSKILGNLGVNLGRAFILSIDFQGSQPVVIFKEIPQKEVQKL